MKGEIELIVKWQAYSNQEVPHNIVPCDRAVALAWLTSIRQVNSNCAPHTHGKRLPPARFWGTIALSVG